MRKRCSHTAMPGEREPSPSRVALSRLTAEEAVLYESLGDDSYGTAVRLEQELIRWDWALKHLGG